MFILDGKRLPLDKAFTTSDGRQFPRNWLRLSSLEEKQALGITEVPDVVAPSYDQRFYWSAELPKDLDQLKEQWTNQVKQTAGTLLAQTDWYVTRQAETTTAVPADVLARRAEIRTYSGEKETAIAATTTVAELASYLTGPDFNRWEPEPEPEPEPEATPEPEAPVAEEPAVEETIDFSSSSTSVTIL